MPVVPVPMACPRPVGREEVPSPGCAGFINFRSARFIVKAPGDGDRGRTVTMDAVIAEEHQVADALRSAGARFALVHGSRAGGRPRPDSDLDVGAWWGGQPPASWEVDVPHGVDLVVLDTAPLWLSGRIAQEGRLLFDDNPRARVHWQAETRLRYLDEIPAIRERYRRRRIELAGRAPDG